MLLIHAHYIHITDRKTLKPCGVHGETRDDENERERMKAKKCKKKIVNDEKCDKNKNILK